MCIAVESNTKWAEWYDLRNIRFQRSEPASILSCTQIFMFCCILFSCEYGSIRMILDQNRSFARLIECSDLFLLYFETSIA